MHSVKAERRGSLACLGGRRRRFQLGENHDRRGDHRRHQPLLADVEQPARHWLCGLQAGRLRAELAQPAPALGVSLSTLNGSSVVTTQSVDGDDGSVDGSGATGHSLNVITAGGATGATFTFNNITICADPKSAAVAVTAANASLLTFTTYDTFNAVSGTYNLSGVGTSSATSDDFLFWASDPAGISAISVTSNSAATSMFLDHLQYDTLNTVPIAALNRRHGCWPSRAWSASLVWPFRHQAPAVAK